MEKKILNVVVGVKGLSPERAHNKCQVAYTQLNDKFGDKATVLVSDDVESTFIRIESLIDVEGGKHIVPTMIEEATDPLVLINQFQDSIDEWGMECFGEDVLYDKNIRLARFLEEALELVQAGGMSEKSAKDIVEYVFGRPVGEIAQEVAGSFVTLNTLATAFEVDIFEAARAEYDRITEPEMMIKIREKSAKKPKF